MNYRSPLSPTPNRRKNTSKTWWRTISSIAKTRTFWLGMSGIMGVMLVIFLLMNYWILPSYTNQGVGLAVPQLIDMTFDEANNTLASIGLKVERREQYHNPDFQVGVVLEQRPPAETVVKPGRVVTLFVNGAERRMVTVPEVIKMSESQATDQITAAGLVVGDIRVDSTSTLPANTVVSQRPAGGASQQMGSRVDLWVSVGVINKTITVPDLYNMPVSQARTLVESLGLVMEITFGADGGSGEGLVVLRQNPVPGVGILKDSVVKVSVGAAVPESEETGTASEQTRTDF